MKIVCATSVLFGQEAFGTLGETLIVPDRQINQAVVRNADALIVRSKTDVTRELLAGSRVRFVGTATAGFDHINVEYLSKSGAAWYAAAGCNANSVAEYVTAALLHVAQRRSFQLAGMTLGIIGVGQVGSRVAHKAQLLGMRVLLNDPPLALKTGDPMYRPLNEILPQCDVVTLHTPLERKGPFPTQHMVNCHFFERLKPGAIFINAARGEVMDTASLLLALEKNIVRHAILDVWENEPVIARELLTSTDIGTPHIAGYSFEGRFNGTVQCYHELCRYAEVSPCWTPPRPITHPALPPICIDAHGLGDEEALAQVVLSAYDITNDDRALRNGATADDQAWGAHFDALRKNYPERREFATRSVHLVRATPTLRATVQGLGFQLEQA